MTTMLDPMRKTIQASITVLSPARAKALVEAMMQGQGREQVSKTAQDLMDWSARNKDRLTGIVRDEVRSQLRQMGVASRDEVEALRKRVRELEKTRRSTAKRSTTRKTTRRSTVKQPGTTSDATATPAAESGTTPSPATSGSETPPSSTTGLTPTG